MKNEKIDYEKLFKLCCGTDDIRSHYQNPFRQEKLYASTDGHSLMFMHIDKMDLPFPEQSKPTISGVIPTSFHNPIVYNVKQLDKVMKSNAHQKDEYKIKPHDCEDCEGEGTLECDLGHIHDCNDCSGTGEVPGKHPTGKKIPDPHTIFKITKVHFQYYLLQRLIDAANILDVKEIGLISSEKHMWLFQLGPVKMIIMAFLISNMPELQSKPIELSTKKFIQDGKKLKN